MAEKCFKFIKGCESDFSDVVYVTWLTFRFKMKISKFSIEMENSCF